MNPICTVLIATEVHSKLPPNHFDFNKDGLFIFELSSNTLKFGGSPHIRLVDMVKLFSTSWTNM